MKKILLLLSLSLLLPSALAQCEEYGYIPLRYVVGDTIPFREDLDKFIEIYNHYYDTTATYLRYFTIGVMPYCSGCSYKNINTLNFRRLMYFLSFARSIKSLDRSTHFLIIETGSYEDELLLDCGPNREKCEVGLWYCVMNGSVEISVKKR